MVGEMGRLLLLMVAGGLRTFRRGVRWEMCIVYNVHYWMAFSCTGWRFGPWAGDGTWNWDVYICTTQNRSSIHDTLVTLQLTIRVTDC